MTPNGQRSRSSTPEPVINAVIEDICRLWGLDDAWEALPYGLSHKHVNKAKGCLGWGEEFLVLLRDLAFLTPGKLKEVQRMIQDRIHLGRATKASRPTGAMKEDILALIVYFRPQEPTPAKPVRQSSRKKPVQDTRQESHQNTSRAHRQPPRIVDNQGTGMANGQTQQNVHVASTLRTQPQVATSNTAARAKRKRRQHEDPDGDYKPPRSRRRRQ
ncbi:hypothetical protein J4E80_004885 [Alternaria sp. BMP 0032]|nr:hypothetical protein J4E80_004885 [Alternaria sp. BMP 0032]